MKLQHPSVATGKIEQMSHRLPVKDKIGDKNIIHILLHSAIQTHLTA